MELDTSFVAAWSLLAQARSWMIRRGLESDTLWAWAAVQHAQRLAPGSLEASVAAGYYRYYARGDFAGALADLSAADRLMPNSSDILYAIGLLERRLGRWEDAATHLQRAEALDLRNGQLVTNIAETFTLMRRFPQAQRAIERALALAPGSGATHVQKFVTYTAMGDTSGARAALRDASGAVPERTRQVLSAELAMLARDYRAALSGFAHRVPEFSSTFSHRSLSLARAAAASGDSALARAHADTLIRIGTAELEARRARGGVDPFGRQSIIEANMAVALAIRGEREEAVRLAEGSVKRFGLERDEIEGTGLMHYLALTYMLAGRRADAIATLGQLLSVPSAQTVQLLRLDPTYDSLRGEPAFQRLVAAR